MARILQHRRGKEADLPIAADGEFLVATDTKKAYMGIDGENICINPEPDIIVTGETIDEIYDEISK